MDRYAHITGSKEWTSVTKKSVLSSFRTDRKSQVWIVNVEIKLRTMAEFSNQIFVVGRGIFTALATVLIDALAVARGPGADDVKE